MGFGHDHSHGHSHGHHESYEYSTVVDDDDDDIELAVKISNSFDKNNIPVKNHKFLDTDHEENEYRTWGVITLCLISMIIEISCGVMYGSLALIGDGIHMSTHAIAFFITATSYSYARRHKNDSRYVFGTAKVGELAAFTSAIILIAISLFILYEGITRFIHPADLQYNQALPVSFVGLFVNIASGVILTVDCKKKTVVINSNKQKKALGINKKQALCEDQHGHDHDHSTHDDQHGHDHDHSTNDDQQGHDHERSTNDDQHGHDHDHSMNDDQHGHDHDHSTNDDQHGHDHEHITNDDQHGHDREHSTHDDQHGHDHEHSTNDDQHGHDHEHSTNDDQYGHDETFHLVTSCGILIVSIYEDGIPPVFRLSFDDWKGYDIPEAKSFSITTIRPDKSKQVFKFNRLNDLLYQSIKDIPEPHQFNAIVRINKDEKEIFRLEFVEGDGHNHGHNHVIDIGNNSINSRKRKINLALKKENVRNMKFHKKKSIKKEKYEQDNNFRAAIIHVVADAVVSVFVIIALVLAGNIKQCYFLDPLVGIVGSLVILSWGIQLINDTSSNLLDMVPDKKLNNALRTVLEKDGSIITDFHVWRLGPGKLGSVISIIPPKVLPSKVVSSTRYDYYNIKYYNKRIKGFKSLSHTTFEIVY